MEVRLLEGVDVVGHPRRQQQRDDGQQPATPTREGVPPVPAWQRERDEPAGDDRHEERAQHEGAQDVWHRGVDISTQRRDRIRATGCLLRSVDVDGEHPRRQHHRGGVRLGLEPAERRELDDRRAGTGRPRRDLHPPRAHLGFGAPERRPRDEAADGPHAGREGDARRPAPSQEPSPGGPSTCQVAPERRSALRSPAPFCATADSICASTSDAYSSRSTARNTPMGVGS